MAIEDSSVNNSGDDAQQSQFTRSEGYTLGVEVEFQTLDQNTWDLAPLAPKILENAPALLRPRLSPEFIQSILEIQTGVCTSVEDVKNDLMQTISLAEEVAEDNNCRLFSASLHPFACHREQLLTTNERYERIMQELQIVGRRFISQGFHVHVGMLNGEAAVRVCNKIQAYLPILLALSTSSPYSQGEDTGLMSYRTKLFEALPLAGMYSHINSWEALMAEVEALKKVGVVRSLRDLWWDTRPNPGYGTVEIRICDLPIRFNDILGITALIQALSATIAEESEVVQPLNPYIMQANKWQAARHGLDGEFVDPAGALAGGRMKYRDAATQLLKMVEPMVARLGSEEYIRHIDSILLNGTGSDYMRSKFENSWDLKEVIQSLQEAFWK
jgi:carboxylate-amine ligase